MIVPLEEVRGAAARLEGLANRTPVMRARSLDRLLDCRVLFKCESFQRAGSFKFRGACNVISTLSAEERAAGVCGVSSGNHAQALALAASLFGIRAAILMPEDAPAAKLEATRGYGAEVVTYDRYSRPQATAGLEFAAERGMTFVSAYDDPRIAAGAGTAMLELCEEHGTPDVLFAPVGGGGGLAGYSSVLKTLNPDARVVAVESDASAVTKRSLDAGRRVTVTLAPHLADGQMLTTPGEFTFEVMRETVDDTALVSDAQILEAMAFLSDRMKLVTEPSGAIATAALLAQRRELAGRTVAVMVSGGNVGIARFCKLLARTPPWAP